MPTLPPQHNDRGRQNTDGSDLHTTTTQHTRPRNRDRHPFVLGSHHGNQPPKPRRPASSLQPPASSLQHPALHQQNSSKSKPIFKLSRSLFHQESRSSDLNGKPLLAFRRSSSSSPTTISLLSCQIYRTDKGVAGCTGPARADMHASNNDHNRSHSLLLTKKSNRSLTATIASYKKNLIALVRTRGPLLPTLKSPSPTPLCRQCGRQEFEVQARGSRTVGYRDFSLKTQNQKPN
jgi:hypothetical protein